MAQHVKVAGDGADELSGSYLSHRVAAGAQPLPGSEDVPDWQWRAELLVMSDEEKAGLYAPDVRQAFERLTARDPVNRMLEAEFHGILPDQVLTFVDRPSMAHSLDVRSAFLDTDVVEYVASLPGSLKIRDGQTKYIFKRAAAGCFPDEMIRRPKKGFLIPVTEWVLGELQPWVCETLSHDRLSVHGLFDASRVDALVAAAYRPGSHYRAVNKVVALVIFQEWYEMYLD